MKRVISWLMILLVAAAIGLALVPRSDRAVGRDSLR